MICSYHNKYEYRLSKDNLFRTKKNDWFGQKTIQDNLYCTREVIMSVRKQYGLQFYLIYNIKEKMLQ